MSSALCFLLPLIVIAVILDIFIVKGRQRLRQLQQEEIQQDVKMKRRELWIRAFFPFENRKDLGTWIKTALEKIFHEFFPARWWLLAAGIASIGYGQYLMETQVTQGDPFPAAERWNVIHKLEIINYENVVYALPYFLIGAVLCATFGMPDSWKKSIEHWSGHWRSLRFTISKSQLPKIVIGAVLFTFLLYRLSGHQYEPSFPFIWGLAVWIFTYSIWKSDNNTREKSGLEFQWKDFFWIVVLLILGFGICTFALQDIPIHIIPDEGAFWETARAIARNEIHPAIFDSGVYTFPIASSVFQGWILKVFGVNFWGWRFASVIPAVMTVIPLYLLAKLWFDRVTAITACALMLANPYFISFARMGYNNSQALFPVTLCIFFFALAINKRSYFYLWLAGLTAGLGFYTYFATWIAPVTLVLGVAYLWIRREFDLKRSFVVLALLLAGWAVAFTPRIVYTSSGPLKESLTYKTVETSFVSAFYGRAYFSETELSRVLPLIPIGDQAIYYEPLIYGELLYRGSVRTFIAMFNPFIVFEHFLNSGLSGVITPVFFLIGLVISLRSFRQLRFALLLIWLIFGMFFLSIIGAFPPRHTHLVSIIPCLALIAGAGLNATAKSLTGLASSQSNNTRLFLQSSLLTAATLASVYYGFQRYHVRMPVDYPSPFEDIASWLALRAEEPVEIIYLGETSMPHRVEYLVNIQLTPHTYKTTLISEFSPETELVRDKPAIIFVDSPSADQFPLENLSVYGFGEAVSYQYKNEYTMGYAVTNTEFDLKPTVGVADGFKSLTNTPVRYVFMVLFSVLIVTGIILARDSNFWFRKGFLLEIGKSQSEVEQIKGSEGSERPEFHLHLRIRVPPWKKK